ncbi:MAG: STM3941 family protein [Saprospiraceae bacterium]
MENQNTTEIKSNKFRLVIMLFGSLLFVGLGVWFVLDPASMSEEGHPTTTKVFLIGLASLIFFCITGIMIFLQLLSKTPGLIISDLGVTDNTGGIKIGFIPWTDIAGIAVSKIRRVKFVHLVLKNPQEYIDRQENSFRRRILQFGFNHSGTISNISTMALKINQQELKMLLEKRLIEYQSRHASGNRQ